jgi:lipopolysaccharide transport protein LptA
MAAILTKALFTAACLSATLAASGAEIGACGEDIEFKSGGDLEADLRSGKAVMRDVSISQCGVSITANRAEASGGIDFKDSRWTFFGDVRMTGDRRGSMQSDQADVEFRNNLITRATIKGSPAKFEQQRSNSAEVARGHADTIVYEVATGTVRFMNDAWLSNGEYQISAPLLVYDMKTEKVRAPNQAGKQTRITVAPKKGANKTPKPESDSKPESKPTPPADGEAEKPE